MASGDRLYHACCVAGLVLGFLTLLSVLGVFIWQGSLEANGIGLAFIGCFLLTLSFWQSVKIKVAGAELILERAKQVAAETKRVVEQATPIIEHFTQPKVASSIKVAPLAPQTLAEVGKQWKMITGQLGDLTIRRDGPVRDWRGDMIRQMQEEMKNGKA